MGNTTSEPYLIRGVTSKYNSIWTDDGTGTQTDVSIFEPTPDSGFYIVGHYAQGDHGNPHGPSLTLKQADGGDGVLLKAPVNYKKVWDTDGSGAKTTASIWYPVPPDGYVSLGCIAVQGKDKPSPTNLRCVRLDWVQFGSSGVLIWNDVNSSADSNVALYAIGTPGCFMAQGNHQDFVPNCFILKS